MRGPAVAFPLTGIGDLNPRFWRIGGLRDYWRDLRDPQRSFRIAICRSACLRADDEENINRQEETKTTHSQYLILDVSRINDR